MTDTSKEAVEQLVRWCQEGAAANPRSYIGDLFSMSADALPALLAEREALTAEVARLTAERDRQYDENVARIAAQAEAEAEIARLTAALAQSRAETQAALAGCVKIKPLVWEDADQGMCTKWRAAAMHGHYELVILDRDDGLFSVNFHWGRPLSFWFIQGDPDRYGPTGPKKFPSIEAAKAAAQADYESRILAAIQPDAAKLAQIREVVGNLVNHDAFQDEEYMSEDLVAKLNAARSALAIITAQEGK